MEHCIIHLENGGDTKGPIIKFKKNKSGQNKSWDKIIHSIYRWKGTSRNSKEYEVSLKLIEQFSLYPVYCFNHYLEKCPSVDSNYGYHRECYQRYTNIRRINTAEERFQQEKEKRKLIQMHERGES